MFIQIHVWECIPNVMASQGRKHAAADVDCGLLGLVDKRCGGTFDHIDDVLLGLEHEGFMASYKGVEGIVIDALNAAAPTIAPG